VLKYYQDLKVEPNETLVFYYAGHGAYDTSKGHLLTFVQGDLPRASLMAAMQKHKPRLTVVLTDCCAVYDDLPGMKPNTPVNAPGGTGLVPPKGTPGKLGPPGALDLPRGNPPRPPDYKPPSADATPPKPAHPPRPANYRPPPPFIDFGPNSSM